MPSSNKQHSKNKVVTALSKPLSRRAFFGLGAATGTLAVAGSTTIGDSLVVAYADENDQYFYKIIDVNRKQVPVAVTDCSSGSPVPVEDVDIKFTNYDTDQGEQKPINVKTDSDGMALPELWAFSKDCLIVKDSYSGTAMIEAYKEGYQHYEKVHHIFATGIPNTADDNGTLIEIPMIKDDGVTPYASCFCLEGKDIGHFAQEVGIDATITSTFDIYVRVRNIPADKEIFCKLLSDRKPLPIEPNDSATSAISDKEVKIKSNADGVADLDIKGKWFGTGEGLPHPGSKLSLSFVIDGATFKIASRAKLIDPLVPSEDSTKKYAFRFDKDNTLTATDKDSEHSFREKFNSVTKYFFSNFIAGFPFMPISIETYASGEIWIIANVFSHPFKKRTYKGRKRTDTPDDRKRKWFTDQCGGIKDSYQDKLDAWRQGIAKERYDYDFCRRPISNVLELSVKGDILGILQHKYDDKTHLNLYDGALRARVTLGASWTLTELWMAGPVPLNLRIEASAKFLASWEFGMGYYYLRPESGGYENIPFAQYKKHPYKKDIRTKMIFQVWADFAASVGVGIRDILGAYARIFFWFRNNNEFTLADSEHSSPYWTTKGTITIGIELVVEFFMFKVNIAARKFLDGYVCWEKPDKKKLGDGTPNTAMQTNLFGGKPVDYSETVPEPTLITEDQLRNVVEFKAALNSNGSVSNYTEVTTSNGSRYTLNTPKPGVVNPYDPITNTRVYNPIHGIKATSQEKICEDIFFGTHMKTFKCNGDLYLLRISAIEITPNSDFNLYTLNGCNFLIPKDKSLHPTVKRDTNNKVVFDDKGNVVYDIPNGMDSSSTATFAEECFSVPVGATAEERKKLITEFFDRQHNIATAEANTFAALPASNGANSTVIRTRVTCAKFNKSTYTWEKPKVVEFEDTSEIEYCNRYNSFDVDMDAVAIDTETGWIRLVVNTSARNVMGKKPTIDNTIDTLHAYRMKYNLLTNKTEDVKFFGGDDSYSAPRLSDADAYHAFRRQTTRTIKPEFLGLQLVSETRIRPNDLYQHAMNVSYNVSVGDARFDERFENGLATSFFIDSDQKGRVFSAWLSQEELVDNEGGIAVFWSSYLDTIKGEETVAHEFVYPVKGVDNIVYLGTIDETKNGNPTDYKIIRYLLINKENKDGYKTYSAMSFKYAVDTGKFVTPITAPSVDMFGNAQIANLYKGEDANHLYGSRIAVDPNKAFGDENFGTSDVKDYNPDDIQTVAFGPFVSDFNESNGVIASHKRFQLVEARWNDEYETFLDPFPIAELDFIPDSVEYLGKDSNNKKYFVITSITNDDQVKADVYMLCVPQTMATDIPVDPKLNNKRIRKGETSSVDVTVANVGNMPISQFGIKLTNTKTGEVLYNQFITDLTECLDVCDVSNYRPVYLEGKPTGEFTLRDNPADKVGVLWPGQNRAFIIDYQATRDEIESLTLKAEVYSPKCEDKFLFEDEVKTKASIVTFDQHMPRTATYDLTEDSDSSFNDSNEVATPTVMPIDFTYENEKGEIVAETDPAIIDVDQSPLEHTDGTNTVKASTSATGQATSSTGDKSLTGLMGAAALGAVGAGVAAYEKRRADNEKLAKAESKSADNQ